MTLPRRLISQIAKIAFEINATVIEADIAKLSDKSSRGIATDIVKQYRSSKEINLLTEIEFSGTALNLKEAIEFEFEGQKYTVSVEFPNGGFLNFASGLFCDRRVARYWKPSQRLIRPHILGCIGSLLT